MSLRRPFLGFPTSLRLTNHFLTPQSKLFPLIARHYSSKIPSTKQQPSPPPSIKQNKNLPQSFRKTIPGETDQPNTLLSRLPSFPLRNNATLLPKPGVPMASSHSLRSMLEILNNKTEPELIYEAEPHRLYFLCCGAFALVFTIYGITFFEWSTSTAYGLYKEDQDLLVFLGRLGISTLLASLAGLLVSGAVLLPTRLIRRIYYLPGKIEHIRFTTHPLLPGRATPVHTIPLAQFNRTKKGRIFTKNGIYGTLDKSTLFFLLKEEGKKFGYWLVDRNGWFWGDGRIFDVKFGKDSMQEAENALTYDEKFGQATKKLSEEKKKLKERDGRTWQLKLGGELMREEIENVSKKLKNRDLQLQKAQKRKNHTTATSTKSKTKSNKKKQ